MEIVIAYLEEKLEITNENLARAKTTKKKKEYIDFLTKKSNQFTVALNILHEATVNEANREICSVKGCNEPVYEFARCFKHYCQSEDR